MRVNITPSLLMKLNMLSSNYNIEIGGYLIGEVKKGEIHLQDIMIPSQTISSVSVNINPRHQIELAKKYGFQKCQKIIGHWHSHHNMGCFWSGQDRLNMNNIMEYKPLFVFIVSSKGNHLVKVCMRNPLNLDIEDIDLNMKSLKFDLFKKHVENVIQSQGRRISSFEQEPINQTYKEYQSVCEDLSGEEKEEEKDKEEEDGE